MRIHACGGSVRSVSFFPDLRRSESRCAGATPPDLPTYADLSADLFNAAVERIICTARPRGGIRTGAPLDDQSMAQLDELLMPPAGAMPPGPNEMEEDDLFK